MLFYIHTKGPQLSSALVELKNVLSLIRSWSPVRFKSSLKYTLILIFKFCTGFLQCTVNPDFGAYPEYLEWFVVFQKACAGFQVNLGSSAISTWGAKIVLAFYMILQAKQSCFVEICFGFSPHLNLENQASQLRNVHSHELNSKKVPMNLLKAQTTFFLHDYFLFCYQELGCFDTSFDKICYNLLCIL